MLTLEQATQLAQAQVDEIAGKLNQALRLTRAPEFDRQRGWAFSYNTVLWEQTRQPTDGLVGNGPIFVDKMTGSVFLTPSGGFRSWIDEYNETGVPPQRKRLGRVGPPS